MRERGGREGVGRGGGGGRGRKGEEVGVEGREGEEVGVEGIKKGREQVGCVKFFPGCTFWHNHHYYYEQKGFQEQSIEYSTKTRVARLGLTDERLLSYAIMPKFMLVMGRVSG